MFFSLWLFCLVMMFSFVLALFVLGVAVLVFLAFALLFTGRPMRVSGYGVYVGQVFGELGVLVSFLRG